MCCSLFFFFFFFLFSSLPVWIIILKISKQFLDADKSGQIDATELKKALEAAGVSTTENQISELVKMIDTDGNGQISKAEFRAFVGTSKVLSTQDVVDKMKMSMTSQLRLASGPQDMAQIYLDMASERQAGGINNYHQTGGGGGGGGGSALVALCVTLLCFGGIFGLYIYGVYVGAKYTDPDATHKGSNSPLCNDAARWILVFCSFAMAMTVICTPVQNHIKKTDPLMTEQSSKLARNIIQLLQMFACGWAIYGCILFFDARIQSECEKEVWNWGYVYFISLFSFIGLACCCSILAVAGGNRGN